MVARKRISAGRVLWGVFALAAVLYGLAQAAIRSPWFRAAVERRLSEAAGMEVRVGRIRATESLNLRIGDIGALDERAGMEVRVLRVKWSFFAPRGFSRIRKVSAEDAVLTIAPDGEGRLLPAFAGGLVRELAGRLAPDLVPDMAQGSPETSGEPEPEGEGVRGGAIPHLRLVRGVFSLRDASGGERASAKDVEIDRFAVADAEGRPSERWEIRAAEFAVEGMRLTGVDCAAEREGQGQWRVTRFESDGWSGWSPASNVERATEDYRALLDSI